MGDITDVVMSHHSSYYSRVEQQTPWVAAAVVDWLAVAGRVLVDWLGQI